MHVAPAITTPNYTHPTSPYSPRSSTASPSSQGEPIHSYSSNFHQITLEQQGSTTIDLVTQDGDTINISLQSSWYQSAANSTQQSSSHSQQISFAEQQHHFSLHFEVEGELDSDEQQALEKLLQGVGNTADLFFSGQLPQAIESLSQFEFNSEEFTSMALSMERNLHYSEIHQYQSTAQLSPIPMLDLQQSPNLPGLAGWILETEALIEETPSLLEEILYPEQFLQQLLHEPLTLHPGYEATSAEQQQQLLQFITQFSTLLTANHLQQEETVE